MESPLMSQEPTSEFDRRTLLKGAAAGVVTAGIAGADGVAPAEAQAQGQSALQDPKIQTESLTFMNGDTKINGFLARPKVRGKVGTVLIAPDIFGLSPYAKETAATIAQAGLACLVVDQYSRATEPVPGDIAQLRSFVGKWAPDAQNVSDHKAALAWLKKQNFTNGKYGVTGFCMGGRITLLVAAANPEILAASPYYGPVKAAGPTNIAPMDVAGQIKGAVQGHYGADDMNPKPEDVEAFYAKLKETNPKGEFFIYPGAGHAFHSAGRPSYREEAAKTAWARTLAFFQKNLQ